MSKVYFISDLHLGHKGVLNFAGKLREGHTIEEHDQILIDKINSKVNKKDLLYILGDVSYRKNELHMLSQIPCSKILVRGNHDDRHINEYLAYFEEVYGIISYKNAWLTHCPIHPDELRKKALNIHGHCHQNSIKIWGDAANAIDRLPGGLDPRYINVSVEIYNGYPIPHQDIIDGSYWNKRVI